MLSSGSRPPRVATSISCLSQWAPTISATPYVATVEHYPCYDHSLVVLPNSLLAILPLDLSFPINMHISYRHRFSSNQFNFFLRICLSQFKLFLQSQFKSTLAIGSRITCKVVSLAMSSLHLLMSRWVEY
jgi:hypothetical protein